MSIFKAVFAKGAIQVNLLADQRADPNLTLRLLLAQVKKGQSDISEKVLNTNKVYRDVTGNICLTCYRTATLGVFLNIASIPARS